MGFVGIGGDSSGLLEAHHPPFPRACLFDGVRLLTFSHGYRLTINAKQTAVFVSRRASPLIEIHSTSTVLIWIERPEIVGLRDEVVRGW